MRFLPEQAISFQRLEILIFNGWKDVAEEEQICGLIAIQPQHKKSPLKNGLFVLFGKLRSLAPQKKKRSFFGCHRNPAR